MPEPAQSIELIDRLISDQRARWSSGDKRPIEDYIQSHPQLLENVDGLLDLIYAEYCLREESGEQVSADDYAKRFPGYFERMKPLFALHKAMGAEPTVHRRQQRLAAADGQTPSSDVRLAATVDGDHSPNAGHHMSPAGRASSSSGRLRVRCPSCHLDMEVAVDTMFTELTCHSCGSHFSLVDSSKATHVAPPLSQLGRFELIERLGVGGFGSVWKARDKELDRTVAVKIPRAGGTTAEEHEKFFREARAAAQLRHPNIVSVHEVGRDGDSVYIVSDFVRGVTLSDWLTGQRPTNREAAELCIKIADALHHAHEQGVVHRDLKPANVMIDGNGQPHLMDFGLARRDVGEVTVTMDGHILGTPAYMSPEQAQGQAHTADRRSDVYSLGVLLFQLLTGEMPFRGNVRMILHQVIYDDPPSPRKLNPHIPRDLETITLKCLDKAPSRRYQSARQLSDDLGRFLRSEPIEARPLGRLERGCRWCRRHPAIVSIIGLGIALIVTMSLALVAIYQAKQRADYNTQLAEQNEATVRRTLHLLQQLFKTADPVFGSAVGFRQSDDAAKISLGEVLNRAVPTVLEQVKQDQPAVGVEVLYTLGDVYRSVGVYDAAEKILSQARESAKQLPDTSDAKALAEFHWGWYCHDIGRYKEAEASYERSRELRLSNYSENSLEVAEIDFNRAWLRADLRKPVEAIQLFRRVLDIRRSRLEDTSFEVQTTAVALKILLLSQDKHKDAMMVEILVGGRPDAMVELIEVFRQGKMLRDKKKYDEALVQYLKLYEGVKQRLNPGHPLLVFLQVDLAGLYREMGNMPAAEDLMREAIKGSKMLFDNNPKLAKPLNEFAHALARRGDVDEAARMYRRALAAAKDHDPVLEGMIQKSLDALPKSQASSEGKKSAENEEKKSADRAHGKSN